MHCAANTAGDRDVSGSLGSDTGTRLVCRLDPTPAIFQPSSRSMSIADPKDDHMVPAGTSRNSPNAGKSWQVEIEYPLHDMTAYACVNDIDVLSNNQPQ